MFINSKAGFKGDFVLSDSDIPCLPRSPTGQSVISCSQIVRANARQLEIFSCTKIGDFPTGLVRKLEKFVTTVPTLTSDERKLVLDGFDKMK